LAINQYHNKQGILGISPGSGDLTTNCAVKLDALMKTDDAEQISSIALGKRNINVGKMTGLYSIPG
jgi:hypothetical protein